jgi:hypothetical protein
MPILQSRIGSEMHRGGETSDITAVRDPEGDLAHFGDGMMH